jgi:hypothetical protein
VCSSAIEQWLLLKAPKYNTRMLRAMPDVQAHITNCLEQAPCRTVKVPAPQAYACFDHACNWRRHARRHNALHCNAALRRIMMTMLMPPLCLTMLLKQRSSHRGMVD